MTLTVVDGDGALHDYHSPQLCPDTPAYTCYESPPGLYRQLRDMAGSGYMLLYKNGTMQIFGPEGQLQEITDRDNNQINLYYYPDVGWCDPRFTGPPDTLCRVDDPSGRRRLLFHYNMTNGLVESVQEWLDGVDGRQITYVYDDQDLASVVYPEGGEVAYLYDPQHRMTFYNDPRQPEGVRRAEEITYDGQDRVITATYHVDSFFDVTYDLPPEMGIEQGAVTAVVVTDSQGQQSRVEFDEHANVVYEGDWFDDLGRASLALFPTIK